MVATSHDPWISQSIDKGSRWGEEIAKNLEACKVGIICLTKDNLDSKWIHYEAGALSKTNDTKVCTFVLDLIPTDVEQPLAQFQPTKSDSKEDVLKLLHTINNKLKEVDVRPLPDATLSAIFEKFWPSLEESIQTARSLTLEGPPKERSNEEMFGEILSILRQQSTGLESLARERELELGDRLAKAEAALHFMTPIMDLMKTRRVGLKVFGVADPSKGLREKEGETEDGENST